MSRHVETLVVALQHEGFQPVDRSRDGVHLCRRVGHRDDHVLVQAAATGLVGRVLQRQRVVTDVRVGQVWRLVEQAFNRPVPVTPRIPDQVHVATDLAPLLAQEPTDVEVAAVVDAWCARTPTPADVLAAHRLTDPVLRLEFAVVARDRAVGRDAADEARRTGGRLRGSRRRAMRTHVDLAEARLP